ncbi:MAG: bifunctional UDP-N-acetylglucosamine diphosphorylase/glucosamine-1-phosphate N-acetyltransferase GlmU [Bdellovibrionales bacterium]|jgi:bifunctional UDP-N-acetylglucosamine pyrophosphorylase/glucosamine-1-phosphate N-acetyltransferase
MTDKATPVNQPPLACVILAAGQGTRMKSSLPKILHPVASFPMIHHVVRACEALAPQKVVVVVAPAMEPVQAAVAPHACAIQQQPLGTGDAVKAAREALSGFEGHILVLFGDTPLITPASLTALRERLMQDKAALAVAGFVPADPAPYGRLVMDEAGRLQAIVEAADATPAQKAITLCNGGIMLFKASALWSLLDQVGNDNAKGEYYLTDCIALAAKQGLPVTTTTLDADDVRGVNTRVQLAEVEAVMQSRLRKAHMLAGVTMIDPATVFLAADTVMGRDVSIGPNVVFATGVVIEDNVEIRAFSHLDQVTVKKGAIIGPFVRLRPKSVIGEAAHIGNFVEIKNTKVAKGAKVNHLSYIGDASVGEKTNIGAGTITCNYDGFTKAHTEIGAGAFIGSNTALVAPVTIGDGAIIAAGSTITQDIPSDALAIARERQTNTEGWAGRFRALQKTKS